MRIACPWCGTRPEGEFTYGGDAGKIRPQDAGAAVPGAAVPGAAVPGAADLESWIDYVYLRENPAGPHREYWHHTGGCRSWLVVTRDTLSHEISRVAFANPPAGGAKP